MNGKEKGKHLLRIGINLFASYYQTYKEVYAKLSFILFNFNIAWVFSSKQSITILFPTWLMQQRHEVPQNFRRLLSTRLRRLVAQDKLEKVCFCLFSLFFFWFKVLLTKLSSGSIDMLLWNRHFKLRILYALRTFSMVG